MAGEMLVLTNPRKRRKAKSASSNPKKRRTKRVRRARPKTVTTTIAKSNPRRRRRASPNPAKRRRARPNPSMRGLIGQLTSSVMPAVQGAAGAIAVNLIYNKIPLPAMLKSGVMGSVTKAVLAVGLGMLAGKFGGGNLGRNMASGALTVLAYDQLRTVLPAGLSDVGYYSAGEILDDIPNSMSGGVPNSLDEYISDYSAYQNTGEYIS